MDDPSELWKLFFEGDASARNDLVVFYSPLVNRIAAKIKRTSPIPVEDLQSDGMIGLMDAIDKYDPDRGVRFESYAALRIRGAIIDGVRAMDWVPRTVRSRSTRLNHAIEAITHAKGRNPTLGEVAEFSGLSRGEVGSSLLASEWQVTSFDADESPDLDADTVDEPGSRVEIDELRLRITRTFTDLDDREKMLFSLYYNEGLTLSEIGIVLGVTEARVCQMHTKAIRDIYSRIGI